MKRTTEAVTINVEIQDRRALYRAALAKAKAEGMSAAEYHKLRREDVHGPVGVDLIMLLDPGSLPGCDVLSSEMGETGTF